MGNSRTPSGSLRHRRLREILAAQTPPTAEPASPTHELAAAEGRRLLVLEVRARIKGTLNTNANARFRFLRANGSSITLGSDFAGATERFFHLSAIKAAAGTLMEGVSPGWSTTETVKAFADVIADNEEIAAIHFFLWRSNATDAVEYDLELVAAEV